MTPQTIETRTTPADTAALVDALGLAWAAFTLYEDPSRVDSFERAVATLGRCPAYPYDYLVGADGFLDGETLVPHRREATVRVARRLFGLGASGLQLQGPPSADDLLHLFRLIAVGDSTEPTKDLRAAGITSITVTHTIFSDQDPDPENEGEHAWYMSYDGDPEPFITSLMAEAGADARSVAEGFVAEYERVSGLVDSSDRWGVEEVTHAFVDAFWYLPAEHRAAVFSLMLERRARMENLAFLDQFGTMELAEMNRMFGSAGHPLLAEYLRVASEEDGRQTTDLSSISSDPSEELGRAVIQQVANVLSATDPTGTPTTDAAMIRLRTGAPKAKDHGRSSVNVIRGLLGMAEDPEAFGEAASAWAGRVTAALRAGNLRAAEAWMQTAAGMDLDASYRSLLMAALRHRIDDDAVDTLVGLLIGTAASESLLGRLAPLYAASPLVEALGSEPTMARRKKLLAALTPIVRARPATVTPYLQDPRWYLVRNVVLVLGTSGHRSAADEIAKVAGHSDHRVRIEVLRALIRLRSDGARNLAMRFLDDPETASEASAALAGMGGAGVDETLIDRLSSVTDVAARIRVIDALGKRKTEKSIQALRKIADRPFAFFGTARRLKRAARAALGGAHA